MLNQKSIKGRIMFREAQMKVGNPSQGIIVKKEILLPSTLCVVTFCTLPPEYLPVQPKIASETFGSST